MLTLGAPVSIKFAVHKLVARENLHRAENGDPPLTQQEIARGAGVSQPVISTILRRKATRVDLNTINGLCNFFKAQPGDLFEYAPDDEGSSAA